MHASQPTTAAGVGVDADGVAEIKRDVPLLGGVSADHHLAGTMRFGRAKFLVNDGEGQLLVHRCVGLEVGMDEDVCVSLKVGLVAL